MNSFFGYNVLGKGPEARGHLLRLHPAALLYMDGMGEATWAAAALPEAAVIHRVYSADEDVMHRTPGRTLTYLQARAIERGSDRIFINLACEPQISRADDLKRLNDEQLEALRWAKRAGVRVAALHLAHYGIEGDRWRELDPLTDFICANEELFLFCCDEYGAGHMFSGVLDPALPGGNEAGHIHPEAWNASPVPYYYHVGRITNYWRDRQARGLPLPRTVITESGVDALGDVTAWRNSLIKASGYNDIRGWKSLTAQWQAWYGGRGWSPERAYLEMLVAAWHEIYRPWPNIVGACLYCWGSNNDRQWDQFRLDEAGEFQSHLESTVFERGETPMPTPTVPRPVAGGRVGRLVRVPKDYVNIRAQPNGADVGDLRPGDGVTFYPDAPVDGWIYVEPANGQADGWVSLQNGAVQFEADAGRIALVNPCGFPNIVTSYFGQRPTPEPGDGDTTELHDGVDFAPPYGTPSGPRPVLAPADGVVLEAGYSAVYGNYARLAHRRGDVEWQTLLGHMARVEVVDGDVVTARTRIGEAGSTGRSTALHVHLQLKRDGVLVDPLAYMRDAEPETPPEPDDEELVALRVEVERLRDVVADKEAELDRLRAIMTTAAARLREFQVSYQDVIESLRAPGETL